MLVSAIRTKSGLLPNVSPSIIVELLAMLTMSNDTLDAASPRFLNEQILHESVSGSIYKVYDTHLRKTAAVKKFNTDLSSIARHEYEIYTAIGEHPNVAQAYDLFYDDINQQACLVMEFCDDGSLVDRLTVAPTGFGREEFLHYSRQLAAAVMHMHSKGVAHRDIKGDNVCMMSSGRTLKLLDLGESQVAELPVEILQCGTITYLAPEIVSATHTARSRVNIYNWHFDLYKSDVWALGITMYSMSTSRLPFQFAHETDIGYLHYLRRDTFGDWDTWCSIDGDIQELLLNMCDPDPNIRWSMEQVVHYLSALS
ncbi:serine/threonine protein kinase [Sphaeroforma arctica JP610]|uniref:Serine/threonine protein kinase n=1 Tax=Sphaeroforma arctica JP610 TaxID=667725 RepID=A0A0L0G7Y3_9EUKA|nr:serine/threonine protein kinase [Sphaeroforma arctica JP610]KNC85090.1 serine/threonine protein kinase [Sphaeroforma arctica JP610]|eukprot:XP_014158992.1 serine/threonine protein kinase [Sphaeroforma arctica JP610]